MTALDLKSLQDEIMAIKSKWGKEIKLGKAEKGAPGAPFPISVQRTVPKPESAEEWDVEELSVKLVVKNLEGDFSCECMNKEFPKKVLKAIKTWVGECWEEKRKASNDNAACLDAVFVDIEKNYVKILRLVPKAIDTYEGCDSTGGTMRRYNIPPAETGIEEAEGEEITEEEQAERLRVAAALLQKQVEKEEAEAAEREREAEKKKQMALDGCGEFKPVQLSKKAMAELNPTRKEKAGHRWRDTAPKASKPDPEKSKEANAKRKANKST